MIGSTTQQWKGAVVTNASALISARTLRFVLGGPRGFHQIELMLELKSNKIRVLKLPIDAGISVWCRGCAG